MASVTVRISRNSQGVLRLLAARTGQTQQGVLEDAIEVYRRTRLLDESNEAYAALRRNARAWSRELKERASWDATMADGLESG